MELHDVSFYDTNIARDFIKEKEGLRLHAYRCTAGVLTIGYGHTKGVTMGMTITNEQAEEFLTEDLESHKQDLIKLCKVPITKGMFIALLSFVFNFGFAKCSGYSLFRVLNTGDYQGAANWFKEYNKSGGKVNDGLVTRRAQEKAYFTDEMQ